MTQSFFPITPVDVSPGTTGSWQDVACAAHIPAGATGVVLYVCEINGAGAEVDFGLRKKGSTDTVLLTLYTYHEWAMIGVDEDRIFECYREHADTKVYLTGYTSTRVTFFDNYAVCLADSGDDAWANIDISAYVPADTIGVIFIAKPIWCGHEFGLRPASCVEDRKAECKRTFLGITGCSGQEFGAYSEHSVGESSLLYLIGYITDGVVFFDAEKNYSLTDLAEWKNIDCLSDAPDAVMLFFDIRLVGTAGLSFGLRKDADAAEDYYGGRWRQAVIACSGAQVVQGKIESLDANFYLVGYAAGPSDWSGKVAGVTDPAKVLGVEKANIKSVIGVE